MSDSEFISELLGVTDIYDFLDKKVDIIEGASQMSDRLDNIVKPQMKILELLEPNEMKPDKLFNFVGAQMLLNRDNKSIAIPTLTEQIHAASLSVPGQKSVQDVINKGKFDCRLLTFSIRHIMQQFFGDKYQYQILVHPVPSNVTQIYHPVLYVYNNDTNEEYYLDFKHPEQAEGEVTNQKLTPRVIEYHDHATDINGDPIQFGEHKEKNSLKTIKRSHSKMHLVALPQFDNLDEEVKFFDNYSLLGIINELSTINPQIPDEQVLNSKNAQISYLEDTYPILKQPPYSALLQRLKPK